MLTIDDSFEVPFPQPDSFTVAKTIDEIVVEGAIAPPPPPFSFFMDDFNRPDEVLGAPWTQDLGLWEVVSEKLTIRTNEAPDIFSYPSAWVDTETDNHSITFTSEGGQAAVRYQDPLNTLVVWSIGGLVIILNHTPTSSLNIGQAARVPGATVSFECRGLVGTIVTGGVRTDIALPASTLGRTKAGVTWSGYPGGLPAGGEIDNVFIEALEPMTPPLVLDFVAMTVGTPAAGGFTYDVPPGTMAGDIMVAFSATDATALAPTLIPGWTNIYSAFENPAVRVQYKVAGAAEPPSYTAASNGGVGSEFVATYRAAAAPVGLGVSALTDWVGAKGTFPAGTVESAGLWLAFGVARIAGSWTAVPVEHTARLLTGGYSARPIQLSDQLHETPVTPAPTTGNLSGSPTNVRLFRLCLPPLVARSAEPTE